MNLNDIVEPLADLFTWTFGILEGLGNSFNWLIIAVMFVLNVIWIKKMGDYNREAKQNGTMK